MRVFVEGLPQLMDVPFGEFLRVAHFGLIALRFGYEGLVIDNIWGMTRQNKETLRNSMQGPIRPIRMPMQKIW